MNTPTGPAVKRPTILSYGMGVDSTAILLLWDLFPESRPFADWSELTVVTAMTGDEWPETKTLVEEHVLPLLRRHSVRFVQVARSQRYVTKNDGVVVLSDSSQPCELKFEGAFKLSDEMLQAGTVPQSGGARLCSMHAKGEPLDQVIGELMGEQDYYHVMGFEVDEWRRVQRDQGMGTVHRRPYYPLPEWDWNREACASLLQRQWGVDWPKSACRYCPFTLQNRSSRASAFARFAANPELAMLPLLMDEVSMRLNPASTLVPGRPLRELMAVTGGMELVLDEFRNRYLPRQTWAVYDVRRILRAQVGDPTKLANASRSVKEIHSGVMADCINQVQLSQGNPVYIDETQEVACTEVDAYGVARRWRFRRGDGYPAVEAFVVAAPRTVIPKEHGRFDTWWAEATTARGLMPV